MKKIILSFAAALCFAVSASAQNEVPGAVNNNTTPTDENVYGQTKMDMKPGMQNVLQTETQRGAQTDAQLDNPQTGTADARKESRSVTPGNTPGRVKQPGVRINNSATMPQSRPAVKVNGGMR